METRSQIMINGAYCPKRKEVGKTYVLKKHKVEEGERGHKCGVVSVMEERKCCSSKEHRRGENKVEQYQLDSESEGGRGRRRRVRKC